MFDPLVWGVADHEIERGYPCDDHCPEPREAMYRGVSVTAPPSVVFRWLSQLRVAPYSYDWLDNFGRQSPQTLTPGLDQLEVGQRVMAMFELVSFEPDEHITLMCKRLAFGPLAKLAISYVVVPEPPFGTRLLVKIVAPRPGALPARWGWLAGGWVDLVMMRRQLLNLKRLAEGTA